MKNSLRVFLVEQDEEGKFKDPAPENNLMFKNVSSKARKSLDSLDNQIDALILGYEKASIRSKDESERINESLNSLSLTALLMEQEEGEEEADTEEGAEEGGEEEGGETESEPVGSEAMTADTAETQQVPDLDIDKFAFAVGRLVNNYNNLLNPEQVILNRAKNFLDNNYGDAYINRFLATMEEQFGISSAEFNVTYNRDVPLAVGANPAGAGISGG
tara:strand:+ start:288 stop:938 length:651 start_codon:yes stop_codon:yes gene_type:complete